MAPSESWKELWVQPSLDDFKRYPPSLKSVAFLRSSISVCHSFVPSIFRWWLTNNTGSGDSLPGFKLWFCHLPATCVTLGKWLYLVVPQFPHLCPSVGVTEFSRGNGPSYWAADAQEWAGGTGTWELWGFSGKSDFRAFSENRRCVTASQSLPSEPPATKRRDWF